MWFHALNTGASWVRRKAIGSFQGPSFLAITAEDSPTGLGKITEVDKNDATGRRFKAVVRILKRLRNEMVANGYEVAEPVPSYLIECLVWNVPNDAFGHDRYRADVRYVLAHLWNQTRSDDTCSEWGEINELKYLFRAGQPWRRDQVNGFLGAAWNYIGLK